MTNRDLERAIAYRPYFSGLALLMLLGLSVVLGACGNQAAGGTTDMRTIKHAMGETKVPASPKRVVVLDTGELDAVISLGIIPVGAVEATPGGGFLSYF
ncbi:MAG: hypothetical protein J2P36_13650, partial [Ktedonobacteraceae bacterium]|nr:hypothetical protein [Ktedonobacteraceae bacterium]